MPAARRCHPVYVKEMQKQSPSSCSGSPLVKIRATQSSKDCHMPLVSCLLAPVGDCSICYPPNAYMSIRFCIYQPSLLQGTDWSLDTQELLSSSGYSVPGSSEISVSKSLALLGLAQSLGWLCSSTSPFHGVSFECSIGVWLRTEGSKKCIRSVRSLEI